MRRASTMWRWITLAGASNVLLGFGSGCLPENFLAEKAGEILNGLIVSALNVALTGTGLQI